MDIFDVAQALTAEQAWTYAVTVAERTSPQLHCGPRTGRAVPDVLKALLRPPYRWDVEFEDALAALSRACMSDIVDQVAAVDTTPEPTELRPQTWHDMLTSAHQAVTDPVGPGATQQVVFMLESSWRLETDRTAQWATYAAILGVTEGHVPIWAALADTWAGTPTELTATATRASR